MNKKRRVILAGIIFLFLVLLINFASAATFTCGSSGAFTVSCSGSSCTVTGGNPPVSVTGSVSGGNCVTEAPVNGLVGDWNFDDGTARDSSGNSHHGTLQGGAAITTGAGPDGSAALSLDGVNDHVSVPDSPSLSPVSSLAIAAWVNPASCTNVDLAEDTVLTNGKYYLSIGGSNAGCTVNFYTNADRWLSTPVTIPIGLWTHIAATWQQGGLKNVYFNGVLVASAPASSMPIIHVTAPTTFGARTDLDPNNPFGFFGGDIDDVRVYSRALTLTEIQQLAGAVTLPEGISSVTGTVTATGGTNLGDIITVTGGTSGGDINIIDSAGVLTTKISVPAGKEMQFSLNNLGELTILSTNADIYKKFFVRNFKSAENNYLIKTKAGLETSLKVQYNNGFDIFEHEGRTNVNGAFANNANIISELKLSDGWSTFLYIEPDKNLAFLTEQTPSGEKVLSLETTSGLLNSLKFKKINNVFAELKMSANSKTDFFVNELKGTAFIVPNSPGIELDASLSSQAGMTFYSIKARSLNNGQIRVAAPANYKFETNGDNILDSEYTSKASNTFFDKVFGSGYDKLTPGNGINLAVFSLSTNVAPIATVTYNELSITKNIGESETFNFIAQKTKDGREIYVKGNSRTILGSLIEEVSPEAIIEGWNYWYTATDDNYWQWSVILESLPTGCIADKTSASTTVANGVQTLAFYVDCGTATSTTGSVISGFATNNGRENKQVGFATKGRAQLLSSFTDCTKETPSGQVCKPSQKFTDNPEVVKGIMNPIRMTGSSIEGVGGSGGLALLISLLTLAGIIVLIVIQINRKTVNW